MHRLFRRKNQPSPGRKRGHVAWTAWEITLIIISLLLIIFPLYVEAYRWVNPLVAPAAQRETDTPAASPATATSPPQPTDTTQPTGTPPAPSNTPRATATAFTVTPGTITPTPPTFTPTGTSQAATNTPTNTPVAGTATPTPSPQPTFIGEPPLRLVKIASVASAAVGDQFSYSISVFSNSGTLRTIRVRDTIDSRLDIVGTPSASNGSCTVSGRVITCTVTAQTNRPALITVDVRVNATATPGTSIPNDASAIDDLSNTGQSDKVIVNIINQPTPPATVTSGPPPTATVGPPSPTITPGGPGPTATPRATAQPHTPGPGNTPGPQPKPTGVPRPPLPPTPRPGQLLPPTPRPGQLLPPTPRQGGAGPTATPGAGAVEGTATTTSSPTLAPAVPGLFFRMASDWGSQFPGHEVNYVIAVSNIRTSGDMRDLQISSTLPTNLQVLGAKADRGGDPLVAGNTVSLKLDTLKPGEGVEIAIKTKIKDSVAIGTLIISQAELTFTGLSLPAHSNIVTVLVVGAAPAQVTPLQTTTTLTATAGLATATPTPTTALTATMSSVPAPTSPPTATVAPAGGTSPNGAPLPATSSGVPILGVAMLGMTLMLRTVRVHREQTRI